MLQPFEFDHLRRIQVQPTQATDLQASLDETGPEMYGDAAWTMTEQGLPLGCFGYLRRDEDRAFCWCYLAWNAGPYLRRILRTMKHKLMEGGIPRYELFVHGDPERLPQDHRFARLLGFVCETPQGMRKFDRGRTYYLYSYVLEAA